MLCRVAALIVQIIFYFWSVKYNGNILRIQNLVLCLEPYTRQYFVFIPPQTVFVGGYTVFTLSVRPNERTNESVSLTFCFLNILKSH